jgi:ribosomal protein S14
MTQCIKCKRRPSVLQSGGLCRPCSREELVILIGLAVVAVILSFNWCT